MIKNSLNFITNPSYVLVKDAMAFRKARNELINSNIANIDTPFYKARDIRFEAHLSKKAQDIYNFNESKVLQLAKSNYAHMQAQDIDNLEKTQVFFRDGHLARNDGNSVDLDVETTELSKNNMMYNAVIEALKKETQIFKAVISASKNI